MITVRRRLTALLGRIPLDADDLRSLGLAALWLAFGTVAAVWAVLLAIGVRWLWAL